MGGAAAGEVASRMAADSIFSHMTTVWAEDRDVSAQRFAYRMKEAVELANNRIHAYAREHPEVRGMGTTATVAGVFGSDLYLAQVGDSRGYLIRNGQTTQITKDQSLMQRLVEAGELTEEEAEQSERRNIILQALGPDPRVKVDLTYQALAPRRPAGALLRRPLGPGQEGGDRGAGRVDARPGGAVRQADRPRQRARRPRQHHRRGGPVRRATAFPSRTGRPRWATRSIP